MAVGRVGHERTHMVIPVSISAILLVFLLVLYARYCDLNARYEELSGKYAELEKNYARASSIADELEKDYNDLLKRYDKLYTDYRDLNRSYLSLKREHNELLEKYDELLENYDEVMSAIEKGEVIARSATWAANDGRLKVATSLIPQYLLGKVWYYNINVTVTNVGDEPFKVVWIFLFPYINDRLYEYWNPISFTYKVEWLSPGETCYYTFKLVPAEMTSYKVLVVGG